MHVKGRLETVPVSPEFTLMIDYAHNAMALESLLKSLKEYHPKRLVTLFGCGGNRDPHRRYEMGEVSANLSDLTVVTSDNPRFEEPMAIIKDILVGVKRGSEKKRLNTVLIMPKREMSSFLPEKAMKIIRRSRALNIRWMNGT